MLSSRLISLNISEELHLGYYTEHLSLFFVLTEIHEKTLLQSMDKHLSIQGADFQTKVSIRFPGGQGIDISRY